VTGYPVLLERLTQNLLDNAIHYNLPEHGEITVTTETVDGSARFTVENTRTAGAAPTRSRACSSPSAAWQPANDLPTPRRPQQAAAPASDCPSCDPSPMPTAAMSTPHPERMEASP
jgi:hypothetical protein